MAINLPVFDKETYVDAQKEDKWIHAAFCLTLALIC